MRYVIAVVLVLAGCGSAAPNPCSGAGIITCGFKHPDGWARRGGSSQFHGDAVLAGQNCVECHDSGTPGVARPGDAPGSHHHSGAQSA